MKSAIDYDKIGVLDDYSCGLPTRSPSPKMTYHIRKICDYARSIGKEQIDMTLGELEQFRTSSNLTDHIKEQYDLIKLREYEAKTGKKPIDMTLRELERFRKPLNYE